MLLLIKILLKSSLWASVYLSFDNKIWGLYLHFLVQPNVKRWHEWLPSKGPPFRKHTQPSDTSASKYLRISGSDHRIPECFPILSCVLWAVWPSLANGEQTVIEGFHFTMQLRAVCFLVFLSPLWQLGKHTLQKGSQVEEGHPFQRSPPFLAQGAGFVKDNFSTDLGWQWWWGGKGRQEFRW